MIRNYAEWEANRGRLDEAGKEASCLINEYDAMIGYAERNNNGFVSPDIQRHFAMWLETRQDG